MEGVVRHNGAERARPVESSAVLKAGSLEDAPGCVAETLFCLVPVTEVGQVIDDVVQWIEKAMAQAAIAGRPVDEIRARLESGEFRLMLAGRGDEVLVAVVVELIKMRGVAWMFVVAAGGAENRTFREVGPQLWREIVQVSRELGLAGVRLVGRPGWARWCARHGGDGVRVRVRQVLVEARI